MLIAIVPSHIVFTPMFGIQNRGRSTTNGKAMAITRIATGMMMSHRIRRCRSGANRSRLLRSRART